MERPERVEPKPGQESVWDYPRPPRLEPVPERLRIVHRGRVIADTTRGFRVLETSHPPVYYFPPEDVDRDLIRKGEGGSFCEWKGTAAYVDLVDLNNTVPQVGWYYPHPTKDFEPIRNYIAFYARYFDECYVGDEKAEPQPGTFYGGWITSKIVGPFKGVPGSFGW